MYSRNIGIMPNFNLKFDLNFLQFRDKAVIVNEIVLLRHFATSSNDYLFMSIFTFHIEQLKPKSDLLLCLFIFEYVSAFCAVPCVTER
jgi:hypothetical protein